MIFASSAPLRVLLVEDSPADAALIERALRRAGHAVEMLRVDEPAAMETALIEAPWHVVVSDWSMPRFSALGAMAVLAASRLDLPFIIVSGTVGEEPAVAAMRAGANDYVLKSQLPRLAPAIERELREAQQRAEHRRADDALRAAEARNRWLIEHSEDVIVLIDGAGRITYTSPAVTRVLGYSLEEFIGKSALELVHPEDAALHSGELEGLLAGPGQSRTSQFRIVDHAGNWRWIETTATNLLADPAVGAILGNLRDLTERKHAESALLERMRIAALTADIGLALTQSHRLRDGLQRCMEAIVDHLGAAFARIWTLAPDGDVLILEASAGMYEHIDGPHARIPVGSFKIGRIARDGAPHFTNDVANDVEISDPGWAAREGMVAFAGTPLQVNGVLVGVLGMFSREPLTYAARDALEWTAHALAVGVRRAQAEEAKLLLETQLRQAQKMEAVGRLAGGVAHDFNNVLSVILGYSNLLLGDLDEDDPRRRDVREVLRAGERAAEMVHQLMMFSRRQVPEATSLGVDTVLSGLELLLRRLLPETIELVLVESPGLGRVKVDRGHLEQVVMNLVVNARDAMPAGGRITLEAANVELDDGFARQHLGARRGSHVMLAVKDTGTGIEPATQLRIFEPFFTTKPRGKGTGLGLSTVFGIVQQSGGCVVVDSAPGVGSVFRVYLPRTDEPAAEAVQARETAIEHGSETILLVEDEDQVRQVALGILRRYGYDVVEARNAGEALLTCERHSGAIHLLLTDVVMPQMSGPELATRLARSRPDMRIICMSGYTDESIAVHGVVDGQVAFLQKPLTPDNLLRKVRAVLDAPNSGARLTG